MLTKSALAVCVVAMVGMGGADLSETHGRRQLRTNPQQKRARSEADSEHEHDED